MGSVYQHSGKWRAQITSYSYVDGKGKMHRKRVTRDGFRTRKEATQYLETLRESEKRKVPRLIDLYSLYEANDMQKLSADKQRAYKKARERLEPVIGRTIDSLTTIDLQKVVNENADSYYTRRDMKVLLSHLYRAACVNGFVSANLAQFITLPELVEKEAVPFTSDEVQTMWTAFANGDTFVGFLLLMVYSGMMPGELFSIRKDKIDFDRCEIYGAGRKTKTRKDAPIVFASSVKPVLQSLCALYDGDKLYPYHETRFYDDYHETTKRIGIRDLPPYSCRHTTGTEAAKLNLSASTIQKIMRHAKITTSQRYIHLGSEEAHAAIENMAKGSSSQKVYNSSGESGS